MRWGFKRKPYHQAINSKARERKMNKKYFKNEDLFFFILARRNIDRQEKQTKTTPPIKKRDEILHDFDKRNK